MIDQEVTIHKIKFANYSPSGIQRVATDKDAQNLAVLRTNGCLELWNCKYTPYRQKILQVGDEGSVESLTWCKNRILTGNLNGTITEHPLTNNGKRRTYQLTGGTCWCLAVNHQETLIAAGSESGYVSLYSIQDDSIYMERILQCLQSRILSLSWMESGSRLAAASEDKIYLCPLAKGKSLQIINAVSSNINNKLIALVWCVLVLPDFTVVAGDARGVVTFWDGDNQTLISSEVCLKSAVQALAVSRDGRMVYAAGVHPLVVQIAKQNDTGRWVKSHKTELHSHDIKSLAVDAKGRIYSGGDDTHLGLHYFHPKVVMKLAPCPLPGSMSSAADYLLLCGADDIEWWRLGRLQTDMSIAAQNRACITRIACPSSRLRCCALSPSGRRAAYCCVDRKLRIREIHLPSGTREGHVDVKKLQGTPPLDVRHLLWLTESTLLVVTPHNALQLWTIDGATASLTRVLPECPLSSVDQLDQSDTDVLFTATCGTTLAVATSTVCTVYNVVTDSVRRLPRHQAHITAVCVRSVEAPDGCAVNTAMLAYSDHSIVEYDVNTSGITPFGELLHKSMTVHSAKPVVRGLSWNKKCTVLCLHNDNELMFINEAEILNFEWSKIETNKKIKVKIMDPKRLTNDSIETSINEKNSLIFQPNRKRTRTINGVNVEREAWDHLIKVEKTNNDNYVLVAKFTNEQNVQSIELTHDNLMAKLPPPFSAPKFGLT